MGPRTCAVASNDNGSLPSRVRTLPRRDDSAAVGRCVCHAADR
jgi:hypothetical protein